MSENRDFGFCPRCGALMQNGVCQSCGYGKRLGQPAASEGVPVPGNPNVRMTKQPKKSNKLVIGLCIGAGVLLFTGLIAAIMFYFMSIVKSGREIVNHMPEDSYYGGDYYDDYDYYEPSAEDPYYKDIVDATSSDLSYRICWASTSLDPDKYEEEWSYYATYPVLEASEGEEGNFDSINEAVREAALRYYDTFRDYAGGASTYGYVTYMDEDKISVVFKHNRYESDGYVPEIAALCFDVKTGRQIDIEEMVEVNQELAIRFRSQDKTQNGGIDFVQDLSDEELLSYLQDPEKMVAFYTPVGLEVGINYETGWVTVTLKEKAL